MAYYRLKARAVNILSLISAQHVCINGIVDPGIVLSRHFPTIYIASC